MSTHLVEMGGGSSLDTPGPPKAPDPVIEIHNNTQTTKGLTADVRAGEERIPGMVKESIVWDVYNNEGRKVDRELVKDWTASLNSLLLFAAIFAAVLTGFIIESKKMLEPDHAERLFNATVEYYKNTGNLSNAKFPEDFEPTSEAISINCLFFASLGASLVAALASVIALQWVADYDAAITRGGSSPEDRAKRRHFRYAGVVGWKMSEIIASLPLLLYFSVVLFWAGAIQWMWTLHYIVGYVVAGGTAISVFFYASTTLLGAIYASSPFRTPLSRGLYWLLGPAVCTTFDYISRLPFKSIANFVSPPSGAARSCLASVANFIGSGLLLLLNSVISDLIRERFLPKETSRRREDKLAKEDPDFEQDALALLSEQLPISCDSHSRLCLLVSGMLALPEGTTLSPRFLETPWLAILDFLSAHYLQKILHSKFSVDDQPELSALLRCIDHPCFRSRVIAGTTYVQDPRDLIYWLQCTIENEPFQDSIWKSRAPMAFLLARDVPIPSTGKTYELEATCKLIGWRNSLGVIGFDCNIIWSEVFRDIPEYSPRFFKSCLRHYQTWSTMEWLEPTDFQKIESTLSLIVEKALSRRIRTEEAITLAQVFANIITGNEPVSGVDEKIPIIRPIQYAIALERSSKEVRLMHQKITLLMARSDYPNDEMRLTRPKWIVLMLWIGGKKERGYWNDLCDRIDIGVDCGALSLWGNVDMTFGGFPVKGPHIAEIMNILASWIDPLKWRGLPWEPLWINFKNDNRHRDQVMCLLEAFDKTMASESVPELHQSMVNLVCKDMDASGIHWPNPMTHLGARISPLEEYCHRLVHLKDLCLALIGAFTCGIPLPVELTWTKSYLVQHEACLRMIRHLFFRKLSINDPISLWELRAAVWPPPHGSTRTAIFPNCFHDPEQLTCLQFLLQYPTQCDSHGTGSRHMLFHVYQELRDSLSHNEVQVVRFGDFILAEKTINPILAMLALSATQDLSDLTVQGGEPKCAGRIWRLCKFVKRQPTEFLCLLRDIVAEEATQCLNEAQLAIIIEPIKHVLAFPEHETSMPLLRPLASALNLLRLDVQPGGRKPEDRTSVETYIESVSHQLIDKADGCIYHGSLTCARSVRGSRPARHWRAVYVD